MKLSALLGVADLKVKLNSVETETKSKTLFDFIEEKKINSDIVIYNGYQINHNTQLYENDSVVLIKKGVMPNENELEAMLSARHSPNIYEKIKGSTVGIAGLGGLGSNIAVMLARIGVGRLVIADFDIVEPSNLNRQSYYIKHLGLPKTEALKEQIKEINPFVNVTSHFIKINENNIADIFSKCNIICEAFDNPVCKAELTNYVLEFMTDKYLVAASGMAGYSSSNLIKTKRRTKRLYICGDFESEAEIGNGLMSPRVNICAAHQANMVLRLILGIEDE